MGRTWSSQDMSCEFVSRIGSRIVSSRGRTRTSTFTYSVLDVPRLSRCFCSETGSENVLRTGSCMLQRSADRKSTRLNSSHTVISYAVFCLHKKSEQYTVQ